MKKKVSKNEKKNLNHITPLRSTELESDKSKFNKKKLKKKIKAWPSLVEILPKLKKKFNVGEGRYTML